MNLTVNLPPRSKRDEVVDAWVRGLIIDGDFSDYQHVVKRLLDAGYTHNGISCFLLHRNTAEMVKRRISGHLFSPTLQVAFESPLCLN